MLIFGVDPPVDDKGLVADTDATPPAKDRSPDPRRVTLLIVLMLVPLTNVACLPLNVDQSVLVNNPVVEELAIGIVLFEAAVISPFPLTVNAGTVVALPKLPVLLLTVASVKTVEPVASPV